MTTNKTIGLFLLATTFLSSPAGAAALTPTPDTIKSEAAGLSGNFALSELVGDLPEGAVEVKIGDKNYSFTPPVPSQGADAAYMINEISEDEFNRKNPFHFVMAGDGINEDEEGNVYLSEEAFFKIEIDTEADWQTDVYDTDQAGGDIAVNFGGQAKNAVSNPENGKIGKISGNFIVNSSSAILNNNFAEINGINADFISNQAYHGGAIYNRGKIGDISGLFINNQSEGGGNAVFNLGEIVNIGGQFVDNHDAYTYEARMMPMVLDIRGGGAILNRGTIGKIDAEFNNNIFKYDRGGGAILNEGDIKEIYGKFTANEGPAGGAITNMNKIDLISAEFYANSADMGSALANGGEINEIKNSVFQNNYDSAAVLNDGTIGKIDAKFINNVNGNNNMSSAILNEGTIDSISGTFSGNRTYSYDSSAFGAVVNAGVIGNIDADFLNNSITVYDQGTANYDFSPDYGQLAGTGAAITSYGQDLTFTAEGKDNFISGNYVEFGTARDYPEKYGVFAESGSKINHNAIYMHSFSLAEFAVPSYKNKKLKLTFSTTEGGSYTINDNIDGGIVDIDNDGFAERDVEYGYNMNLTGDGTGTVYMNNEIINADTVTIDNTTLKFNKFTHNDGTVSKGGFTTGYNDGRDAVTSLVMKNKANFNLYNKYQDTVNLKGWKASGNSFLHVDVDVENLTADMLNVNGNVEGTTKLVLYPNSDKDIRGESILFAQSQNDTKGNADSFKVWRVYRSPYMFETKYTKTGENANQWELEMNDTANDYAGVEPNERPDPEVPDVKPTPTPDKPTNPVYGEVVAMGALPAAAIEQSRNMVDNVFGQIVRGEGNHNLWINPTYYTSNIDAPFDVDADVWGIEAGGDLQHDLNNKLGLFVSYRKGSYDMNGDGKHYYSTVGSEIDIDSYLAGLYYRYDRNNWYAFATLYGGIQQADIKTDDGVKSDTDGVEFGASLEAGYDYNLTDTVYLTPSLGVFYTQVNYDDATDSVGKKAEYNDLKQIELEAGVKLTKAFRLDEGYASVYVKPSVVQTIVDGDEVNITGLGKTNTLDDETLGRIELGGRYGFTDQLSAYGWANYTFGSDYDATTVGLGLNCAF